MPIVTNDGIPIHDINPSYSINIESISSDNGYDFNKTHRHNYYEILFFAKGGGYQLIDFKKVPIKNNSCYIVIPRQVHLVKRDVNADGLLIQFTDKMILPDVFLTALSSLKQHIGSSIVFEEELQVKEQFFRLLYAIEDVKLKKTRFYKEKSVHLLSNLLYNLEEIYNKDSNDNTITNTSTFKFIELVDLNLTKLSINEYAEALNITSKKLGQLVKTQFGISPLKYIHNVLILNIKRDLVFKKLSHKEIAFAYNFDSPSNFSLFIKKHTGSTPTELQEELIAI